MFLDTLFPLIVEELTTFPILITVFTIIVQSCIAQRTKGQKIKGNACV